MRIPRWLLVGPLLASIGCANMRVTKIPAEERAADADSHVKGFRYYLSRPYVVVKSPIVVSTEKSLIVLDTSKDKTKAIEELFTRTEVPAISNVDAATGSLEPVSPKEWALMRAAYEQTLADPVMANTVQPATEGPAVTVLAPTRIVVDGPGMATADRVADQTATTTTTGGAVANVTPQTVPAAETSKTVSLTGKIDVIFLPDLDEQYAVHNRNVLAKSSYALNFKDGWQLTGVNGDFDSTPVAIEILKTVDHAVNAAKDVGIQRLTTEEAYTKLQEKIAIKGAKDIRDANANFVVYEVRKTRVIAPGLYRVNKPWETDPTAIPTGAGLLIRMGFTPVETITVAKVEVVKD